MKQQQSQTPAVKKNETDFDILNMIIEDHKPLKQLIKVLKDDENDLHERKAAFKEFAVLLVTHAKPEEQTLYVAMKKHEDLRASGFEGEVEHGIADQLIEEIKRTKNDDDLWSARVKVLAEIVEHHIEEEEEEMIPDFRKNSEIKERISLGQSFLNLKTKLLEKSGEDSPNEMTMKH